MPLPQLSPDRARALHAAADRFLAANRVSIIVGFAMGPPLFAGIGIFLWAVIPSPFGAFVGGPLVGAGLLFVLFLLWYRQRTVSRPPYAAWAMIVEWKTLAGRHGDRSHAVELQIEEARAITKDGWGAERPADRGAQKTLVLTSARLLEAAPPGRPVIVLCMPTHEVVAFEIDGQLVTA